jgi:hypothetical protein
MTVIGFILLLGLFPCAIGNVGIVGGKDALLGQFPYQGNLLKSIDNKTVRRQEISRWHPLFTFFFDKTTY